MTSLTLSLPYIGSAALPLTLASECQDQGGRLTASLREVKYFGQSLHETMVVRCSLEIARLRHFLHLLVAQCEQQHALELAEALLRC